MNVERNIQDVNIVESIAIEISNDAGSPIPVSGTVAVSGAVEIENDAGNPIPISAASLPLPTGASTLAEQQAQSTLVGAVTETAPASDTASSGLNGRLQRIAQRLTSLISLLPSSIGTKTSAGSLSVVLASDQAAIQTTTAKAATATLTNVTAAGSTTSIAASNVARKSIIIANDSNKDMYIKYGTTASLTSFTVKIPKDSSIEETTYTGAIDAIWASGVSGAARVTEM